MQVISSWEHSEPSHPCSWAKKTSKKVDIAKSEAGEKGFHLVQVGQQRLASPRRYLGARPRPSSLTRTQFVKQEVGSVDMSMRVTRVVAQFAESERIASPEDFSEKIFRILEEEGVLKEILSPRPAFTSWDLSSSSPGEGMVPIIEEVVKRIPHSLRLAINIVKVICSVSVGLSSFLSPPLVRLRAKVVP